MIINFLNMNGYGLYVHLSFLFTLASFFGLYFVIRYQFVKEQNKFSAKFGALSSEKAIIAKTQKINKEILAASSPSKI
tara:strand:+ start:522 stop:755 length:234 start_codon:yes stop_codon:yes gene_type:complete